MLAGCACRRGALPDSVVGAQADPVGDGAVLLHLLAEDTLRLERLEGRLQERGCKHRACEGGKVMDGLGATGIQRPYHFDKDARPGVDAHF